jgi:hypothetical protein
MSTALAVSRQASCLNAMEIRGENLTVSGRAQRKTAWIRSKSLQVLHDVGRSRLEKVLTEEVLTARQLMEMMFLRPPLLASPSEWLLGDLDLAV